MKTDATMNHIESLNAAIVALGAQAVIEMVLEKFWEEAYNSGYEDGERPSGKPSRAG